MARVKFCLICDEVLPWEAPVCGQCGAKQPADPLARDGARAQEPLEFQRVRRISSPADRRHARSVAGRGSRAGTWIFAVVLLVLGAAAYFGLRERGDGDDPGVDAESDAASDPSDAAGRTSETAKAPRVDRSPWAGTELKRRDTYAHGLALEVDYDRFDDKTTIKAEVEIEGGLSVIWYAIWSGRRPLGWPRLAWASIISTSKSWRFLSYHRLVLIADGVRIEPTTKHTGKVLMGSVLEIISAQLDEEQLATIATSPVVEGKLGTQEFWIPAAGTEALHDTLTRGLIK